MFHFLLFILSKRYNILLNPYTRLLSTEKFSIESTILKNNDRLIHSNKISLTADLSRSTYNVLRKNPSIVAIEEDKKVTIQSLIKNQYDADWNLSRLSLSSNKHVNMVHRYRYPVSGGRNSLIYVIDTGIRRTKDLKNIFYPPVYFTDDRTNIDDNGHGTHVGGIIGSCLFGVAKSAGLVSLKVLDRTGSGSVAAILSAFDFVLNHETPTRKIVNLSIGGFHSALLNIMIRFLTEKNIVVIAAAGNERQNACNFSPASSPDAITVGAIDRDDNIANFSNYGKCVDIYAPGVDIMSDWLKRRRTASGTSMATPHVVGAVALYLSEKDYKDFSPKEIKEQLLRDSQESKRRKILSTRALLHSIRDKEIF